MARRVLIVDDELDVSKAYKRIFTHGNVESVSASNSQSAREEIEKGKFGAYLFDKHLGEKTTGLDLISEIRKGGDETPIVVITGFPEYVDLMRAIQLGVSCFIRKPVSAQLLGNSVATAMKGGESFAYIESFSSDDAQKCLFPVQREDKVAGFSEIASFFEEGNEDEFEKRSICFSSFTGCPFALSGRGCRFCVTGSEVFGSVPLSKSEMKMQTSAAECYHGFSKGKVHHTASGMGEGTLNPQLPDFINEADERHTYRISTVGLEGPLLTFLLRLSKDARLKIIQYSLHFLDDAERAFHMPGIEGNPISRILDILEKEAVEKRGIEVVIQYALFKRRNDREEDFEKLAKLIKGRPFSVRPIEANEYGSYQSVEQERVDTFMSILESFGVKQKKYFRSLGEGEGGELKCGRMAARIRQSAYI